MKVGDKFKLTGSMASDFVHEASHVFLTRSQGWWVNGGHTTNDVGWCSVPCKDTEAVE